MSKVDASSRTNLIGGGSMCPLDDTLWLVARQLGLSTRAEKKKT